ncbi:cytochrome c family protein [Pelagibius sp. CAU 1746]|uniref:c-type cytochrome n=1 Tax=Pelagibius sp. CAU 1746 TaxID=3140370 RepID=UPI00325B91AE
MTLRKAYLAAAVLLVLPAVSAAVPTAAAGELPPGDAQRGQAIYERCQACHSFERNRSGPKHCGLLGREAGSQPGFKYSKALRESGIVWTEASLDRFLANPFKAVPGTRMGYAGVRDPQERADLIAFLATAAPCPQ